MECGHSLETEKDCWLIAFKERRPQSYNCMKLNPANDLNEFES